MAAVMNQVETAPAARRLRAAVMVRLSTIWEAFRVAASSLRQNKLRTSLTLIGIIVGVTAVIADRKSTRLNSSHVSISYAVFCLKKKTISKYVASKRPFLY